MIPQPILLTISHFSTTGDRAIAIQEMLAENNYFSETIEDNLPCAWEDEGDGKLYRRTSDGVLFRLNNLSCRCAPPGVNQVIGKEHLYSHSLRFNSIDWF